MIDLYIKYVRNFLILTFFYRLAFMLLYFQDIKSYDVILSFWYGLRMDFSVLGYSFLPIIVLLLIQIFWPPLRNALKTIAKTYLSLFSIVYGIILSADLGLYVHWKIKIDTTPLLYLEHWEGTKASASFTEFSLAIMACIVICTVFIKVLTHCLKFYPQDLPTKPKAFTLLLFLLTINVVASRGGLQSETLKCKHVYFSDNDMFANHVAINGFWNFVWWLKKDETDYIGKPFMSQTEANTLIESYTQNLTDLDSSEVVLNNRNPNVIVVLLESFTANIVERLGGDKGITPRLDSLSHEGLFFTNCNAASERTEKAILCNFSGFPTLPGFSLFSYPEKVKALPSLYHEMKQQGRRTSFFYGGDSYFARMNVYLEANKVDDIMQKRDFPKEKVISLWGAYDHDVFQSAFQYADKMAKSNTPFFQTVLSLTSHEPFEVPMRTVIHGHDLPNKFRNSIYYTDSCIGTFVRQCQRQPWWQNTIMVFVADHGHALPWNLSTQDPKKYRVPMLWIGGALKQTNVTFDKVFSQTDLPLMLLSQLNKKPSRPFPLSKNPFKKQTPSQAFYAYNNGIAWITDSSKTVYDLNSEKQFMTNQYGLNMEKEKLAKAFYQTLCQYFGNLGK